MINVKVTMGDLIRDSREEQRLSRNEAAKRLKCSAQYLAKLENDAPLPLSDELYLKLKNTLGVHIPHKLRESHNARAKKWYKSVLEKRGH